MLFIEEHVHNSEIIVFEKDLGKEWKLKEEHVPRHYELLERALKDLSKSTAKSQLYKVYNSKDFRISSQGKLESLNLITYFIIHRPIQKFLQRMWNVADNKFIHHIRILDGKGESNCTTPVMYHQCTLLIAQCYHELLHKEKQFFSVSL